MLDFPDSMRIVHDSVLAEWGVEFEQAEQDALGNLARAGMPVTADAMAGCLVATGPDGYISSWPLVPSAFDDASQRLHGPVVALAPSRDRLCFAPLDAPEILNGSLAWAEQIYRESPRRLSPVPYEAVDGRRVPWCPPRGHPLFNRVAMAERLLALYEYRQQKAALSTLFASVGENVWINPLQVARLPDGSVLSWATWGKGVDNALLPYADAIWFVDPETNESNRVSWDDGCAVASDLFEVVKDMDPPRIRIKGWPGDRLDAIRALPTM